MLDGIAEGVLHRCKQHHHSLLTLEEVLAVKIPAFAFSRYCTLSRFD